MQFWKSLAIGLIVLLSISYVGFAYVYSSSGGITIAGMITGAKQSKVVTLLRNSNITNPQSWKTSVDIQGYKTGFLYIQITDAHPGGGLGPICQFEVDEIPGRNVWLTGVYSGQSDSWEISLEGTKMWIWFSRCTSIDGTPQSAVVSMSIYLRD